MADDSFGEDRQVLQAHGCGEVLGLPRGAARNLLGGRSDRWVDTIPLIARAEWADGHPRAVFDPTYRL